VKNNNHLRVVIVGLEAGAQDIHLPVYKSLADKIEIVAGFDIDGTARRIGKEKFNLSEYLY